MIFSLNDRARSGKSGNKASRGALFCRSLKYLACDEWRYFLAEVLQAGKRLKGREDFQKSKIQLINQVRILS